ncbi:hypothetical protein [Halorubrum sp. F4]|uniref:hypothetical protein n=1 Tax=Halorubrum sp. F4 TaxID=2989715 RepID=UPI0024812DFA|nr:hypothetical protein [Halorubrum sp. F4]
MLEVVRRDDVPALITRFDLQRPTVFTDGGTVDNPANSLAHLSPATDKSTVLTVEPILEVIFVEQGVVSPFWYLIENAVGAFDAKLSVTGTTDLGALNCSGDSGTPAMATANESTSVDTVESVLVVGRLFLVMGAAPPREIQRFYPLLE